MPTLTTRPAFPLVPDGAREHTFPQTADISSSPFDLEKPSWLLDFTEGGRHPGVVVSQSRMRDIELVVNPLSSMDEMNTVNIISFGTGSWIDLLVHDFSSSNLLSFLHLCSSSILPIRPRRKDTQLSM